jgi:hypothetical protein
MAMAGRISPAAQQNNKHGSDALSITATADNSRRGAKKHFLSY